MDSPPSSPILDALRGRAREAAPRARAPYSGRSSGAALLLSDGRWAPGVRVESASYPLSIPALVGGLVTAFSAGRHDVRAVALSTPFLPGEAAWLADALGFVVSAEEPDVLAFGAEPLPEVGARLELSGDAPESDEAGVRMARAVAERAHVPESGFRVGCVLVTASGQVVPGCNVEHADWTRGLCAERSALAAAAAYGAGPIQRIYLSCPADPRGTPCGACRQLLAEYAADVPIVMDRGDAAPEETTAGALLPQFFSGDSLRL
ncbi:MAG: cytidine deaminase [Rhodothermales bacterium]